MMPTMGCLMTILFIFQVSFLLANNLDKVHFGHMLLNILECKWKSTDSSKKTVNLKSGEIVHI